MYDQVSALLLSATLFLLVAPTPTQSGQERSQAQRVVHENPEVIKLQFAPLTRQISQDVFEKISGPFVPGSKITFKLIATKEISYWFFPVRVSPRLSSELEIQLSPNLSKYSDYSDISKRPVMTPRFFVIPKRRNV
jgi:hypothetical protein